MRHQCCDQHAEKIQTEIVDVAVKTQGHGDAVAPSLQEAFDGVQTLFVEDSIDAEVANDVYKRDLDKARHGAKRHAGLVRDGPQACQTVELIVVVMVHLQVKQVVQVLDERQCDGVP